MYGASLERERNSEQVRTDRRVTVTDPAGMKVPGYPDGPEQRSRHGSKAAGERSALVHGPGPEGAPQEV